jgi:hypothetical protein
LAADVGLGEPGGDHGPPCRPTPWGSTL